MSYFAYIVKCADGTFYTGYTTDVKARIETHNKGKGAKYTRVRLPVKLMWFEELPSKSAAMKREYQIKQMSRLEKKCLIKYGNRSK